MASRLLICVIHRQSMPLCSNARWSCTEAIDGVASRFPTMPCCIRASVALLHPSIECRVFFAYLEVKSWQQFLVFHVQCTHHKCARNVDSHAFLFEWVRHMLTIIPDAFTSYYAWRITMLKKLLCNVHRLMRVACSVVHNNPRCCSLWFWCSVHEQAPQLSCWNSCNHRPEILSIRLYVQRQMQCHRDAIKRRRSIAGWACFPSYLPVLLKRICDDVRDEINKAKRKTIVPPPYTCSESNFLPSKSVWVACPWWLAVNGVISPSSH